MTRGGRRGACDPCLGRCWLLGRLAGHIERVVTGQPGARSRELLALGNGELIEAVGGGAARALLSQLPAGTAAVRSATDRAGVWTVCIHAADYPRSLRSLEDAAPAALLGRGPRELLAGLDVTEAAAIVGARRGSTYGRYVAGELGLLLGGAGVAVVSGLARGIDAAAHRGALAAHGLTIAVLGSGPDVIYPRGEASLYRRIAETGIVVSEMPPGFKPYRWSFPARNRIMAALAGMTVVVEAAERSGSLITAGMAAELGREVGAVPGPVTASLSRGTNGLLYDGAQVVRGAQDVLDRLLGVGARRARRAGPALPDRLVRVVGAVESGHSSSDAVVTATALPAAEAAAALTELELLGYLRVDSSGRYVRTPLDPIPGS